MLSEKATLHGKISTKNGIKQGFANARGETGKSLEYLWEGTSLGVKREDEEEYKFTDLKGERGNPFKYSDFTEEQLANLKGPKGDQGIPGVNGTNGTDGADGNTPNISIGTITTLPAGSQATVTKTGTDESPILNFGIPKGDTGATGGVNSVNGMQGDIIGLATNQDIQSIEEEINSDKIHTYTMTVTADTALGAQVTLPFYYKVGNGSLYQVQYFEYMLLKAVDSDTQGQYYEVGQANSLSNKIQLASDAKLKQGDILTFYVRGEWSNEQDAG